MKIPLKNKKGELKIQRGNSMILKIVLKILIQLLWSARSWNKITEPACVIICFVVSQFSEQAASGPNYFSFLAPTWSRGSNLNFLPYTWRQKTDRKGEMHEAAFRKLKI